MEVIFRWRPGSSNGHLSAKMMMIKVDKYHYMKSHKFYDWRVETCIQVYYFDILYIYSIRDYTLNHLIKSILSAETPVEFLVKNHI